MGDDDATGRAGGLPLVAASTLMPTRADDVVSAPSTEPAPAEAAPEQQHARDEAEEEAPTPPPYSASSAAAAFQNRLAWRIESCSVGRGKKRKAILRDIGA